MNTDDGTRVIEEFLAMETHSNGQIEGFIANLDGLDFERNRTRLAEGLKIRVGVLDTMRPAPSSKKKDGQQGREIMLEDPEPWPDRVDGAAVLTEIREIITRHLIAEPSSIVAMTLWVAHSFRTESADIMPLLTMHSPVKRSGKTTALEIVKRLVPKPIPVANISTAALFRAVEKYSPTLLVDEADTLFRSNEDLRTLVNCGFSRTAAFTIRCTGEDSEPRLFSTWCPKAVALIGQLPDTLADRSVLIPMRRKTPGESVERLRADRDQGFTTLKRKLSRWTSDHAEALANQDPDMPITLNDRQADIWRELLKIADYAGGIWPNLARKSAQEITAQSGADDDDDAKTALLRDLKAFFDSRPNENKHSAADLSEHLAGLDGTPWPEWRNGKPLTTNSLAKLLKGFGIRPKKYRFITGTLQGYLTADFNDVFPRYLQTKWNMEQSMDKSLQIETYECSTRVPVPDSKWNNLEQSQVEPERIALEPGNVPLPKQNWNMNGTEMEHVKSIPDNDLFGNVPVVKENASVPQGGDIKAECSRLADRLGLSPSERSRMFAVYGDLKAVKARLHRDLEKIRATPA